MLDASHCLTGWELQQGDIKGAILEAGPLDSASRPLFARQPAGGIPGVPEDAVIEMVDNLYGQKDAPAAWFREFSGFVISLSWHQSVLDPCLFTFRDPQNQSFVERWGCMSTTLQLVVAGNVFRNQCRSYAIGSLTGSGVFEVVNFARPGMIKRGQINSHVHEHFR